VFHVAASDTQRVWGASAASVAIVVQPFFWQTYGFASMVLILGGCAAFAWYRRRIALVESRRLAQEEFTRQLIATQEAERARLARELHDDITQRLARLAIDAARIEQGHSGQAVENTMRGVRERLVRLSEDVHTLSYRLHSSVLEDLGLVEALKAECERFARQESIACEVKLQGDVPNSLPHETSLGLFRITQEALRNVARHAQAGAVGVTLRRIDDGLQLAVHDDGSGFDPVQKRERVSLGLTSMRERMHLIGGELDIESAPGHGTSVVAWVPVKGNEP
jgi:signal transduction histidine kinase